MEPKTSLSDAWEQEAQSWVQWARKPGHDSYWKFHRDQFLELLPPAGKHTIDIGCGEGRLSRHLKELGHRVTSFDSSITMIDAAQKEDPTGSYAVAKANALPLANASADLAIAFMVFQDVDDLSASVRELGRILTNGGRACVAIVHPLNSAGTFDERRADSEFRIKQTYLGEFRYCNVFERDGMKMKFHSVHRSIEQFSREFERASLCIEAIREHPVPDSRCADSPETKRWQRVPLFLHFRLVKYDGQTRAD